MIRHARFWMLIALSLSILAVAGCGSSSSPGDPCTGQSCSDHGICDGTSGQAVCTCDTGYDGTLCDACAAGYSDDGSGACVQDTSCTANSCSGHGSCDDSAGAPVCTCDTGYTGSACDACATGYHDDGAGNCILDGEAHPQGWSSPDQHGAAAKAGAMDCRSCHGSDLTGDGDADSCDACHNPNWRTNCVFCHGGTDNQTGAPPVDLAGETSASVQTVGAHSAHLSDAMHMAYDCDQCHVKPTDVLSPGHMFDATPGVAEVDLSGGLSDAGAYDGQSCSSLYCHGDGSHDNGTMANYTDQIDSCTACHAAPPSTGRHTLHKNRGYSCNVCHADVASDSSTISGPELHVNGEKNVNLASGGTWNANTKSCNPSCHGSKSW